MYNRLGEIEKQHKNEYQKNPYGATLHPRDIEWLIEQSKTLKKITDTWVAIETSGNVEEADNFYTLVQDILTPKYD